MPLPSGSAGGPSTGQGQSSAGIFFKTNKAKPNQKL
jgi:hypothetical protein